MTNAAPQSDPHCVPVPPFKRLNYHYGQMLGAHDFQTEQDYFRHKMLLQNRCLHGYGVVCGLVVEPAPPGEPDDAKYPNKCPSQVAVPCGLGLDLHGHELVVRDTLLVNLWKLLPDDEKRKCEERPRPLYILLGYQKVPIEKKAVEQSGDCLASNTYTYAKVCESVCVRVTTQEPPDPSAEPCETCCTLYDDACLWLARIDNFERYKEIKPEDIHNEIRRPLSRYRPTVITGINWVHGASYYERDGEQRLNDGLRLKFSRPVLKNSLRPGVMDIRVTDDWTGTSSGSFQALSHTFAIPADKPMVEELSVKVECRGLKSDERVLIILRTNFILDACCQPVDGDHVGGWVPLLPDVDVPEYIQRQQLNPRDYNCPEIVNRLGLWQSGNGTPGGTFESWFFVQADEKYPEKRK